MTQESMKAAPAPEFSRLVSREVLARGPQSLSLAAEAGERAALARRFGLLALDRLEADLTLVPDGGDLLLVEGRMSAEASQECVVTLEPVPARIEAEIALLYSLAPAEAPEAREQVLDPEAEDPPEPVGPAGLDLGEALAQQFALALEPYPRAEGADLEAELAEAGPEPALEGPFAALAGLKPREG